MMEGEQLDRGVHDLRLPQHEPPSLYALARREGCQDFALDYRQPCHHMAKVCDSRGHVKRE